MSNKVTKEEVDQQVAIRDAVYELNQKKKHLDWFDYQKRGGRFEGKAPDEVKEEREGILEEIKELEKKVSELVNSD